MCVECTVGVIGTHIEKVAQVAARLRQTFPEIEFSAGLALPAPNPTQLDQNNAKAAGVALFDGAYLESLVDPLAQPTSIWQKTIHPW